MSAGEIFLSFRDTKSKTFKCTLNYLAVTQRLTVGIKPIEDRQCVMRADAQWSAAHSQKKQAKYTVHAYTVQHIHIYSMYRYIHNPNVSKI